MIDKRLPVGHRVQLITSLRGWTGVKHSERIHGSGLRNTHIRRDHDRYVGYFYNDRLEAVPHD